MRLRLFDRVRHVDGRTGTFQHKTPGGLYVVLWDETFRVTNHRPCDIERVKYGPPKPRRGWSALTPEQAAHARNVGLEPEEYLDALRGCC